MQRAYEDCEDYWQTKLSEERQLFEKERQIYEDEQHESDKKFTELMEKVREYEEQFSKDGRLSPIDERDMLEQQYSELEAEAAQLRSSSIQMLEEKAQEISSLQSEIEDLRQRLGESVEILTGACELTSESVAQLSAEAGKVQPAHPSATSGCRAPSKSQRNRLPIPRMKPPPVPSNCSEAHHRTRQPAGEYEKPLGVSLV